MAQTPKKTRTGTDEVSQPNLVNYYTRRGTIQITFYDLLILAVLMSVFTFNLNEWFLLFLIGWKRPYVLLGEFIHQATLDMEARRIEKKIKKERK